jgi:hypothetical protein
MLSAGTLPLLPPPWLLMLLLLYLLQFMLALPLPAAVLLSSTPGML